MTLTEDEWLARHVERRSMKHAIESAPELSLAAWCEVTNDDPSALVRALEDLADLYQFPCDDDEPSLRGLADLIDW